MQYISPTVWIAAFAAVLCWWLNERLYSLFKCRASPRLTQKAWAISVRSYFYYKNDAGFKIVGLFLLRSYMCFF